MGQLAVTISYLEREGQTPVEAVSLPDGFSFRKEGGDIAELSKSLYYEVGESHFWWERRLWSDAEWRALSDNANITLWVLYDGEQRAGYFELNFAELPAMADLAFLGLYPSYIGKGLGKALLAEALRRLQERSPETMRVNTCDLDHAAAYPLYESYGFRRTRHAKKIIDDPRLIGALPKKLSLPKSYRASGK